ncbi:MAG: arylsulfatase [Planctomycetaceae bacterium]|nr:arylsulfatase [Planctomycetaceae bacterium]
MTEPSLAQSRPNILLILADDLSYRDLGCFGQRQFDTPVLDGLCRRGLKFTQAYSGSPECAPARASLMTGMHMGHCRIRTNASARGQDHLETADVTIAQTLKAAGYATCMVGKWGIGLPGTDGAPEKKGFDVAYGFYDQASAHTYYPHYLYENGRPAPIRGNYGFDMDWAYRHNGDAEDKILNAYDAAGKLIPRGVADAAAAQNSEDLCYQRAIAFLDATARGQAPFFLYYATQIPHGPLITPDLGRYRDKPWPQKNREWAAMIDHLDRHVGGLLDTLAAQGRLDNTLVIFASDNGYSHWGYMGRPRYDDDPLFRNKGPWKGGKFISWEGGVRVPMFIAWPGRVAPGTTENLTALYDLPATLAELAGAEEPPATDGISIVPLLQGRPDRQTAHEFLYWESGTHAPHAQAVRMGRWFAWREHPDNPVLLWDTIDDVASQRDVAAAHPDLVNKALEVFRSQHVNSRWYLNPGESAATFEAKKARAEAEGTLQIDTRANSDYRGDANAPARPTPPRVDGAVPP